MDFTSEAMQEIQGDRISFWNPKFEPMVKELVANKIYPKLGIKGYSVELRLEKMLVCGVGGKIFMQRYGISQTAVTGDRNAGSDFAITFYGMRNVNAVDRYAEVSVDMTPAKSGVWIALFYDMVYTAKGPQPKIPKLVVDSKIVNAFQTLHQHGKKARYMLSKNSAASYNFLSAREKGILSNIVVVWTGTEWKDTIEEDPDAEREIDPQESLDSRPVGSQRNFFLPRRIS
ncbi:hypothetical protein K440DRAFT_639514 [Wilcoxina mikolae CBS 423.85]|nr:hypothetical protein K440DRAFT_639514 [Wilcoxina mikolae CBS 423.85]